MSARPGSGSFERTWQSEPGVWGWLAEVNNRQLGLRFMLTAGVFFLLGGLLALLMRLQLAVPENDLIGPQAFNQLFTMHGSTMMYLFAVPFMEGLALYLIPLHIGSRDAAFPRLTSFSFWTYLFGGLLFYASFFVGLVPDAGWFAYTPLSGPGYSGLGVDLWLLGLSLVEVAGIAAGVELVVTILKLRAPGMTLGRMPLFAWSMLVASAMMVFAFTVLLVATLLLELDRSAGTAFFDPERGGSTLLWQHLFWFFGHPEVYIIFLPAAGIVSMVIPTVTHRPLAGHVLVVVAVVMTGFLSFGLWVHHMFTTGLPQLAAAFFSASSSIIAVASGTQVFAWIATLWGTRPRYSPPLLWVVGFLLLFVIGGMTGVMVAVVPFDLQVHDTYFVVAHFHYVLIGGAVFPLFAGLAFWLPKITGRLFPPWIGAASFWLVFVGFNLTFFPMHIMGFLGLPRRVYTYPRSLQLEAHNLLATGGSFLLALGVLVFLVGLIHSLRRGRPAGDDPWGGETLEWSTSSPPPAYGFRRPPLVRSRHPMWATAGPEVAGRPPADDPGERAAAALDGAPGAWRATLRTDPLHAAPQGIQWLPGPTLVPLVAALGLPVAALGALAKLWLLVPLGLLFSGGAVFFWLRTDRAQLRGLQDDACGAAARLPVFASGPGAVGWWGALGAVSVACVVVGALGFVYYYLRLFSPRWPQGGLWLPWQASAAAAGALLATGAAQLGAARAFGASRQTAFRRLQAVAAAGAAAASGLLTLDLARLPFGPGLNAYASTVYALEGVAILLLLPGLALTLVAAFSLRPGADDPPRELTILQFQVTNMFVGLAVAVGLIVLLILHATPVRS